MTSRDRSSSCLRPVVTRWARRAAHHELNVLLAEVRQQYRRGNNGPRPTAKRTSDSPALSRVSGRLAAWFADDLSPRLSLVTDQYRVSPSTSAARVEGRHGSVPAGASGGR